MNCCACQMELCIRRGVDYSSASQFGAPWYVFDTNTNTNVSLAGATGKFSIRTGPDEVGGGYIFMGTEVSGNVVFELVGLVWCFYIAVAASDAQNLPAGDFFWDAEILLSNGITIRPNGGLVKILGTTS